MQELEAELYLDEADVLAQMEEEEGVSIMDAIQNGAHKLLKSSYARPCSYPGRRFLQQNVNSAHT